MSFERLLQLEDKHGATLGRAFGQDGQTLRRMMGFGTLTQREANVMRRFKAQLRGKTPATSKWRESPADRMKKYYAARKRAAGTLQARTRTRK